MIKLSRNRQQTCEICAFFAESQEDHGAIGQCRYNPPKVILLPAPNNLAGQQRVVPVGVCPPVAADFWCGCWTPRMHEPEKNT